MYYLWSDFASASNNITYIFTLLPGLDRYLLARKYVASRQRPTSHYLRSLTPYFKNT